MVRKTDLQTFRNALLEYRSRLVGDSNHLRRDSNGDDGHISHAPSHLADEASDVSEQELMLNRLSSSSATLQEVDDALGRIEAGTYGTCEECGAEIGRRRLKVKPYASLCVTCQRQEEDG